MTEQFSLDGMGTITRTEANRLAHHTAAAHLVNLRPWWLHQLTEPEQQLVIEQLEQLATYCRSVAGPSDYCQQLYERGQP